MIKSEIVINSWYELENNVWFDRPSVVLALKVYQFEPTICCFYHETSDNEATLLLYIKNRE